MGTRVDFYVGRGESAEWLGSYPFDGYPDSVFEDAPEMFAPPPPTEQEWRQWVERWLTSPENAFRATTPDQGWPWPWETSAGTDYAYAWDDSVIYGSSFGRPWFRVDPAAELYGQPPDEDEDGNELPDPGKTAVFPDMAARKAVTYGPRSGLIVISVPTDGGAS